MDTASPCNETRMTHEVQPQKEPCICQAEPEDVLMQLFAHQILREWLGLVNNMSNL